VNFKEFQNRSRLYVIGALEPEELEEFEKARKKFGKKAEDYIGECFGLHEAFALSLRPAKASGAIKERLMAMVHRPVNIQASREVVMYFRGELIGQPYLMLIERPENG